MKSFNTSENALSDSSSSNEANSIQNEKYNANLNLNYPFFIIKKILITFMMIKILALKKKRKARLKVSKSPKSTYISGIRVFLYNI